MAEKRAMSRAVLKLTGFYDLGVFGEDESEDFKKKVTPKKDNDTPIADNGLKVITETKELELIGIAISQGKDALNLAVKGYDLTEEAKNKIIPFIKK